MKAQCQRTKFIRLFVHQDTVELALEPFHGFIAGNVVLRSNFGHTATPKYPNKLKRKKPTYGEHAVLDVRE